MAKLKYDRPITVAVDSSSVVDVPKDEVWKVSTYRVGLIPSEAPEAFHGGGAIRMFGGPCKVKGAVYISGIAFKHVAD